MTGSLSSQLLQLLSGLGVTLQLTVVSTTAGIALGLILALLVSSPRKIVRWVAIVVVEFGRGAPTIVMLQLVYYGLPSAGVTLASMPAAWIALGFTTAAYSSEIIRAALVAVPKSQRESAQALGLTSLQILRLVTLPQAARIAAAPLLGFSVQMFQATSLAFSLSIPELLSQAYAIGSVTFDYLRILTIAGIIYAVISIPLMRTVRRLESTWGKKDRRVPVRV